MSASEQCLICLNLVGGIGVTWIAKLDPLQYPRCENLEMTSAPEEYVRVVGCGKGVVYDPQGLTCG